MLSYLAVEGLEGGVHLGLGGEADEAVAAGAAGVAVEDDPGADHLAVVLEGLDQALRRHRPGEVPHEELELALRVQRLLGLGLVREVHPQHPPRVLLQFTRTQTTTATSTTKRGIIRESEEKIREEASVEVHVIREGASSAYASVEVLDDGLAVLHGAHGDEPEPSASAGVLVVEHLRPIIKDENRKQNCRSSSKLGDKKRNYTQLRLRTPYKRDCNQALISLHVARADNDLETTRRFRGRNPTLSLSKPLDLWTETCRPRTARSEEKIEKFWFYTIIAW